MSTTLFFFLHIKSFSNNLLENLNFCGDLLCLFRLAAHICNRLCSHSHRSFGLDPLCVALVDCLEVTFAATNVVAGRDSLGMQSGHHSLSVLSEINSLLHLTNRTVGLVKLWRSPLVGLGQMGACLEVGCTHAEGKLFGVVSSTWSLIGRARQ